VKILKSFFYSGDDFQPVYFWITILMALIVLSIILKLLGTKYISDGLIGLFIANVIGLAGLYNWNRSKNGKNHEKN